MKNYPFIESLIIFKTNTLISHPSYSKGEFQRQNQRAHLKT